MIFETKPIIVYLTAQKYQGQASVMLRRSITDMAIIKEILSAAEHETPIVILPTFSNRLHVLSSCAELGILRHDKVQDKWFFPEEKKGR